MQQHSYQRSGLQWVQRFVTVCLLMLFTAMMARQAMALESRDQVKIRQIIEDQLDAFRKDDAKRAFQHASPLIQERLGSADQFIRMVKDNYSVVYRPMSVRFLKTEESAPAVFQFVQMSDEEGQVWLARYRMLKNVRGQWKIDACELQRSDGMMI